MKDLLEELTALRDDLKNKGEAAEGKYYANEYFHKSLGVSDAILLILKSEHAHRFV